MSTNDDFAIVGLTGGIASGKSTVAEMFRGFGVTVVDADELAREIVQPGEPALEEIAERFGDEVIDEGRLDREVLGDVIFEDEDARRDLEAITHPRIARRMRHRADRARQSGESWMIYDAALIVENNLHRGLDALVVVAAATETQIERLMARDDLGRDEAASRIDAQMPLEQKLAVADYVVDNDGSLEATRRQVERLHTVLDEGIRRFGTASRGRLREEGLISTDDWTADAADLPEQ